VPRTGNRRQGKGRGRKIRRVTKLRVVSLRQDVGFHRCNPSIRPERREVYAKAVRKSGGGRYPHRGGHNDPAAMIEIPRDALGPVTCGRSGLPLLATCSNWHRRLVPLVRHPIQAGLHAVLLQQECRLAGQSNRIEPRRSHHIFITQPASGRRATISSSGLSTPVD
jgi:hypothetical protein